MYFRVIIFRQSLTPRYRTDSKRKVCMECIGLREEDNTWSLDGFRAWQLQKRLTLRYILLVVFWFSLALIINSIVMESVGHRFNCHDLQWVAYLPFHTLWKIHLKVSVKVWAARSWLVVENIYVYQTLNHV